MLKDNIFLPEAAGVMAEYVLTTQTADSTIRTRRGSTRGRPVQFVIKHGTSGAKSAIQDRHLVSLVENVPNALGAPQPVIVNLTVSVPREGTVGDAVHRLLAQLVTFLRSNPTVLGDNSAMASNLQLVHPALVESILLGES